MAPFAEDLFSASMDILRALKPKWRVSIAMMIRRARDGHLIPEGIAGPGGPLARAAIGVAPGTIAGIRNISRQRRSRGWMTVRNRITQQNQP
jgi:hypothetical protein